MLLTLLTILVTLLDITWRPLFSIRGIAPALLLVWALVLAIARPRKSLSLAFLAGLLTDFLVGGFLGAHAMSLVIVSGLTLALKEKLFQNRILTYVILLSVFTFLYPMLVSLTWVSPNLGDALYNLVIFAFFLPALLKVGK